MIDATMTDKKIITIEIRVETEQEPSPDQRALIRQRLGDLSSALLRARIGLPVWTMRVDPQETTND